MQSVRTIAERNNLLPSSGNASLTTRSGPLVPDATGLSLLTMLAQAQAYFPLQVLPDGTPDVYLMAWEEIVAEFGLARFTDALWRAVRASQFFPGPHEIERHCCALRDAARVDTAKRYLQELAGWKRQWEEERGLAVLASP